MKTQSLWFVRHGGRVSGPFPAKLISQDVMLGRFQATDEASTDRVRWTQIQEITELQPHISHTQNATGETADTAPDWERVRREAALRWVDERQRVDRRDQMGIQEPIELNRRSQARRVQANSPDLATLKQRRKRFLGIGIVLLGLLALVLYAVFSFFPRNQVKVGLYDPYTACANPASSQLNWARCDKNSAWLKGLYLTSTLFSETSFNPANLRGNRDR